MIPEFAGTRRFEVLSRLGSGGMGVVYAAHDREHNTQVALKTLKLPTAQALLRLKTEFRALQGIDHPNLVTLGELFEHDGTWFFTMELINGINLMAYLRAPGEICYGTQSLPPGLAERLEHEKTRELPVPPPIEGDGMTIQVPSRENVAQPNGLGFNEPRLRHVLTQLCQGLMALHSAGRVHRDIKPSNVLVTKQGRAVLVDFGLVTDLDAASPLLQADMGDYPVGTVSYMAPEQAASRTVGPPADWYSVGVILYQALTGKAPFSGPSLQVMMAKQQLVPPAPSQLSSAVPRDLDELCQGLLQIEPEARPSPEEILRCLAGSQIEEVLPITSTATRTQCFIGRWRELATLRELFADSARTTHVSTRPTIIVLEAGAGMGKTELIRRLVADIRHTEPAVVILQGQAFERESVPYNAVDGVIDSLSEYINSLPKAEARTLLPPHADVLRRLFPVLGRADVMWQSGQRGHQISDPRELRSLAFSVLKELLTRIVDLRPLLMVVDDLQWADRDSLRLLRALLQPPAPGLCFVGALRVGTRLSDQLDLRPSGEVVELAEILSFLPGAVHRLELPALSRDESELLAANLLSDLTSSSVSAHRIAVESEGNPLFIQELANHAHLGGTDQASAGVRLEDALWSRISCLDEETRSIVELVSVAGAPIPREVIERAAKIDAGRLFRHIGLLKAAKLVRTRGPQEHTVEPFHDRIREAVLSHLEDAEARRWHLRLARALEASRSGDPEMLARHFGSAGNRDRAAQYALRAGDEAAAALAFDQAAKLYELALECYTSTERLSSEAHHKDSSEPTLAQWMVLIRLGEALANAGRGADAAQAFLGAIPGAPSAQKLMLQQRAADQLLRAGHVTQGLEITRRALRQLHMLLPSSILGAAAALALRRLQIRTRGTRFRQRDESEISATMLAKVDICRAVANGLSLTDPVRGADFSTRYVLAALATGEPTRVISALANEAIYVARSGGARSGYHHRLLRGIETLLASQETQQGIAWLAVAKGYQAYAAGDWQEAQYQGELAERHLLEISSSFYDLAAVRSLILCSLVHRGRLVTLERRLAPLVQDALSRGDLFAASMLYLGQPNVSLLNREGPERARLEVVELLRNWSTAGYYLQHYQALFAQVQLDLYQDDGAAALHRLSGQWRRLHWGLLLRQPLIRIEALHLRARAALATAVHTHGQEHHALLQRAASDGTRLDKTKLTHARALAVLVQAGVAAGSKQLSRAAALLEEVVVSFDALDMGLYAAAARRRLGALTGGPVSARELALSNAFMAKQGIREPERITAMLAPGFE